MIRGLYTAASGMITQQRKHDQVTNNIANINTPGYKSTNSAARTFPEFLLQRINDDTDSITHKNPIVGHLSTGVFFEEAMPNILQGDLQQTGHPLDFALVSDLTIPGITFDAAGTYTDLEGNTIFKPQAFFAVQNQNGEERYTRNGRFSIDETGALITAEGYSVLDTNNQPITLANTPGMATSDLKVDTNGIIINQSTLEPVIDQNGNPVSVKVSRIEDPNSLVREGNGLFRYEGDTIPAALNPNEGFEIQQGYIERSNVDSAQAAVDLMTAMRAYEANQKVIQYFDRTLDKSVNDVGRV